MTVEEAFKGPIIDSPNVMSFRVNGLVRLSKGSIQPVSEPLSVSEKGDLKAPFIPVCFFGIQNEVLKPMIVIDVLNGERDVIRPNSREGGGNHPPRIQGVRPPPELEVFNCVPEDACIGVFVWLAWERLPGPEVLLEFEVMLTGMKILTVCGE